VKNVKALGDKLHAAIRENAPVVGTHKASYCGITPRVCKENQRIAIERRRRRKAGEDRSDLPSLKEVWPVLANATFFQQSAFFPPSMLSTTSYQYCRAPSVMSTSASAPFSAVVHSEYRHC